MTTFQSMASSMGAILYPGDDSLTPEELDQFSRGELKVAVAITLDPLLHGDIEAFNDFVSELITGSIVDLQDISYEPIAVQDGHIIVQVKALYDPLDTDTDKSGGE